MCGQSTPRSSVGGAIACLSRCYTGVSPERFEQLGKVIFHDMETNGSIKTSVSFADWNRSDDLNECVLMIHHDGNLLDEGHKPRNVLHRCPISWSSSRKEYTIEPDGRLALAVGGTGVIGRRVTIFSPAGELDLAEGIIGWN